MWSIELQCRRLESVEPENADFVLRRWADFDFLIVALTRLRRETGLAAKIPQLQAPLGTALGRTALKLLQSSLRAFRLELNEDKTESRLLPDGLFRPWVSQYHAANPSPRRRYRYPRFREVYLSVVTIDRANPGTGVIDRFLADLVNKNRTLRLALRPREIDQTLSLLLMLPTLRAKVMPKVLASRPQLEDRGELGYFNPRSNPERVCVLPVPAEPLRSPLDRLHPRDWLSRGLLSFGWADGL
jgi:hypothetical protein